VLACSDDGTSTTDAGDDAEGGPDTSAPVPSTTVAATSTTRGELGSGRAVTLAFAGDSYFEGELRSALAADPASVLADIAPVLGDADITVINLETAITEGGTPEPKQFTFRAPPSAFDALLAAGVDVASMANNHGVDFGPAGLADSLAAIESSRLPVIGLGRNEAEAFQPHVVEVRGQRIAIIGASRVIDSSLLDTWPATPDRPGMASAYDVERLTAEVRSARAMADTVVVFLHWGIERDTCPEPRQVTLAGQLRDAGADIVVGGHAHRLQGAGFLGRTFVGYGLGNFLFAANSAEGARSGVLAVTVTGRRVDGYEWRPARIVSSRPRPLSGAEAAEAVAQWEALRACTGLTSEPT
jgi:poly-gamma-glutamate synthesis protein (capsule biosynthesis protein)